MGALHRKAKAGTLIFREEDKADHIMILHMGQVKLSRFSQEGKEFVLDILEPGTIYGEQRLFSGLNQGVNAMALSAVSYCQINRREIEALILRQPQVGIKMLAELGSKHSRASQLQEILSIQDAKGRLAGFLLHAGGEMDGRQGGDEIAITRSTLSASVNLRHETISRKLKEMEKEGLLALKGHKMIQLVNKDGLRALFETAE